MMRGFLSFDNINQNRSNVIQRSVLSTQLSLLSSEDVSPVPSRRHLKAEALPFPTFCCPNSSHGLIHFAFLRFQATLTTHISYSGKMTEVVSMTGADRISSLPDSLLHHILSLLKTTEVVRTRILSKRWNHVWTSVPILKFESSSFPDVSEFERFLNFVFEHRQTMSLDTFELHWNNTTSTFKAAERWLSHIVKCEPQVIVLYLNGTGTGTGTQTQTDQPLDFINYIFEIGSLEKLDLQAHFFSNKDYFVKPKSISLNNLKELNISGLMNLDDDFMNRLMRGSPVLEKLFLNCYCAKLSRISSLSLKHLDIYYVDDDVMNISAPNLISLSIDNAIPGKFSCDNLVSLVEAYVDINYCSYDGKATFLSSFSNAKILHFPNIATNMFEEESLHCQTFYNLRELDCQVTSFYPIADFLQHAPNLEQLTLRYYDGCDEMSEDYQDRDFSICCKKLKTIEIYHVHLEEARDALNLLSYIDDLPDNVDIRLRRA